MIMLKRNFTGKKSGKFKDVYSVSIPFTYTGTYDYVDKYFLLDEKETELFRKMSIDSERRKKEAALERERNELENRRRLLTAGEDRDFYKKKKSDTIWWKKEVKGEHKFSFDKEVVFDLMSDYPDKLTVEQKEIFDRENPIWAKKLQKKDEQIDKG